MFDIINKRQTIISHYKCRTCGHEWWKYGNDNKKCCPNCKEETNISTWVEGILEDIVNTCLLCKESKWIKTDDGDRIECDGKIIKPREGVPSWCPLKKENNNERNN